MDIFSAFLPIAILIAGFVALIKGADLLVDGSSSLAKRYHVSNLVIGLTIVAFGTSTPELIVNILASLKGIGDLAVGNIIGSNISNILLILGATAVIYPLRVHKNTIWKEIPLSILATVIVWAMVNDSLIDGFDHSTLSRVDGFILLAFFAIFLYYTFGIAHIAEDVQDGLQVFSVPKSITYAVLGIIALSFGGQWVVDSATTIATRMHISESVIGLSLVAVGTSLPELATSLIAAFKKETDIAVGNIIGSNIFNILWILGLSSVIHPIAYSVDLNFDVGFAVMVSFLLFAVLSIGKGRKISKKEGYLFLILYAAYLGTLVVR